MEEQLVRKVEAAWPQDGLESVEACPLCGSRLRELLYEGLRDRIFFCAPGEWTLYRCSGCGSGYLDPRPTRETIHLAYRNYFTHAITDGPQPSPSRPFARVFANGYRNWRYGTREEPSSRLGVLVKILQPARRAVIDAEMRQLPRPWSGARLLDFGCGSGRFLALAKSMGWEAFGLDFDPKAIEVAKSIGLNVMVGDIGKLDGVESAFDVITLSHVIEHVHDPNSLLQSCYKLLKPGGQIWVETPNLDSIGRETFGSHWQDLDPPRHLVIFSYESLRLALRRAGFDEMRDQPFRSVCQDVFGASEAISKGHDPQVDRTPSRLNRLKARWADREERRNPGRREFVTIIAVRSQ